MATYREITDHVRLKNGFVPKTCWIAHVLSDHGKTHRTAPNRQSLEQRTNACPSPKRPAIEAALRHFGMI